MMRKHQSLLSTVLNSTTSVPCVLPDDDRHPDYIAMWLLLVGAVPLVLPLVVLLYFVAR